MSPEQGDDPLLLGALAWLAGGGGAGCWRGLHQDDAKCSDGARETRALAGLTVTGLVAIGAAPGTAAAEGDAQQKAAQEALDAGIDLTAPDAQE